MDLHTTSVYVRELKRNLPPGAFAPALSRLWWLPVHVSVMALGIVSLARSWVPGWLAPGVSLLVGGSCAGLTFLAHETLHGAVVRQRALRQWVGRICFAPFMISPRLWIGWHNRVHHGNTNCPGTDPDAYPTVDEYAASRTVRIVTDRLGPGDNRITGALSHLVGFTVQSAHMLAEASKRGILSVREQRLAVLESGLMATLWIVLGANIGWFAVVFGLLLPLVVANCIVMGFILTNHTLSPLTTVNDPLVNSLSVTAPRWVEWLTMGFGHHVEHHLFPWMSARHAPLVRALIRARWPERYQAMPLWRALLAVHRTGRVYTSATTLSDVTADTHWTAILPRAKGPQGLVAEAASAPERREAAPLWMPLPTVTTDAGY